MKFFILVVMLMATARAVQPAEILSLSISGSVAQPGVYTIAKQEASLALLLERAGGILPSGTDQIRISVPVGSGFQVVELRGADFYAGDRDFLLPNQATVHIVECSALGLGNLTPAQFARLEEDRREYLRRKRQGKIARDELFRKKG